MAQTIRMRFVIAAAIGSAALTGIRVADAGYSRVDQSDPRHPCRPAEPYYDHGPNWGENPATRHPVYGTDPTCGR